MALTKIYPGIKAPLCTHQIERRFSIVAFPRPVNLGLRKYDETVAIITPLELYFVPLEKAFLRDGRVEARYSKHLDSCG